MCYLADIVLTDIRGYKTLKYYRPGGWEIYQKGKINGYWRKIATKGENLLYGGKERERVAS